MPLSKECQWRTRGLCTVPFSNVFDFEVLFPETDKKRRIRIILNKCIACAARNVTIATCTGGNNNENGVCGNFAT